jgi:hypothetical protein
VLGHREAELHHRQQRVATGEQTRLGAKPLQQRERFVDAARALVLKRCWDLHGSSSLVS